MRTRTCAAPRSSAASGAGVPQRQLLAVVLQQQLVAAREGVGQRMAHGIRMQRRGRLGAAPGDGRGGRHGGLRRRRRRRGAGVTAALVDAGSTAADRQPAGRALPACRGSGRSGRARASSRRRRRAAPPAAGTPSGWSSCAAGLVRNRAPTTGTSPSTGTFSWLPSSTGPASGRRARRWRRRRPARSTRSSACWWSGRVQVPRAVRAHARDLLEDRHAHRAVLA